MANMMVTFDNTYDSRAEQFVVVHANRLLNSWNYHKHL